MLSPKKNKIAVTGGAGFIGSHLVKKLIDQGKEVAILDDFSSGSLRNLSGLGINPSVVEIKKIDLTDFHQAAEGLAGAETVYHFAARVGGINYLHNIKDAELLSFQGNLAIDSNVFRACLDQRVRKIVYASSTAVYPLDSQYDLGAVFSEKDFIYNQKDAKEFPFRMSINPDGGYGMSKLLGEVQLNWISGIKIGIARIFNIYGVNEPLDERSHAVSDLIRKAMDFPNKDFVIWGNGKQTRDYLYVSDCVDVLMRLEERISDFETSPLVVNIGSGGATSIRELAEIVIAISGKDIKPKYDLNKIVGPVSRTADINKARELLSWEPKIGLKEGLKRVYSWIETKIT